MNFSNYPEEVQAIISCVLENRYKDRKLVMKYCEEIINLGNENEDPFLLGFAYYYKAECYFAKNEYHKFIEALAVGIEYQQQSSQWLLLTKSYNVLGINAYTQGSMTVALDHYLVALQYSEEHGFDYEKAMLYTNIAHIYMTQKNYQEALSYLEKGREIFTGYEDNFFAKSNMVLIDITMGRAYLALDDIESARKCKALIDANDKKIDVMDDTADAISILCFQAQLEYQHNNDAESRKYSQNVVDLLDSCSSVLDIHDDIMQFARFLLETENYLTFISLVQKLDVLTSKMDIPKVKMDITRLWIRYFKQTAQKEKYLSSCARLYEWECVYEEENSNITTSAIQLRFRLEESRKKEEQLLQEKLALIEESETDALTGLANRRKLNAYAEMIFAKAFEEEKNLGIEMVDIDYFKQYNDTYGHQAGDEVIKTLANCMKTVAKESDAFCARYGGDEFVFIYYDKTDEEILQTARKLKEMIAEKKIEHCKSEISDYVTISQGIRNTIPRNRNKIWDFQFGADTALYKMKRNGRNGVYLVHEMEAESANTVMIKE